MKDTLKAVGLWLRNRALPAALIGAAFLAGVAVVGALLYALGIIVSELANYFSHPLHKAGVAFSFVVFVSLATALFFEKGRNGIAWCWNNLGSAIATFGMIAMLFGISLLLAYAFLQLDYYFSRPLAGDVIPPNVTQAVAWGTRLFTLIAGSAAIYFHQNDMPSWRRGAVWLGAIGTVLLMAHAYGVAAKIMEGQYAVAGASSSDETAIVTSISDKIADIDEEIRLAGETRDSALKVAQETIEGVKDPVAGLSTADNETIREANDDKEAALTAYKETVERLQNEKKLLREDQATATGNQAVAQAMVNTFNPLFTFLARITTLNFDPATQPPEGHKYVWGAVFFTFFFGFGEIALIFCLTASFASLRIVSDRKKRSAAAKKGHETRKAKEAEVSEPLKIEDNEFWLTRIPKALNTGLKRRTIKGMCQTYFGTIEPGALREHLYRQIDKRIELSGTYRNSRGDMVPYSKAIERGLLSADRPTYLMQEHIDFIFSEGEYAPKPKQELSGTEQPLNGASDDGTDDTTTGTSLTT
jgi:hypothetical protein